MRSFSQYLIFFSLKIRLSTITAGKESLTSVTLPWNKWCLVENEALEFKFSPYVAPPVRDQGVCPGTDIKARNIRNDFIQMNNLFVIDRIIVYGSPTAG